jgi:tRNA-specific 2-thiouridylase
MKVLVAMSGGVDSTVSAWLLKERGYDVIGIHFIMHNDKWGTFKENETTVKRLAERLKIPILSVDVSKIFTEKVVDYFYQSYLQGKTPNPCIFCNRSVKFQVLLDKAYELDATKIATGHYAQNIYDESRRCWLLKKGVDEKKDQSYFLYTLNQELLSRIVFPLGSLKKTETEEIAQRLKIKSLTRPESQDICFIPDNDYVRFIKESYHYLPKSGPIVNTQGKILGQHRGIIYYTVGQRKRIGIPARKPLYVVGIDTSKNEIIVGFLEDVYQKRFLASRLNFISFEKLKKPLKVQAKIRSTHLPSSAQIIPHNDTVEVIFDEPQWAITPGQAVVFYEGDIVIGGGIIDEVIFDRGGNGEEYAISR